MRLTLDRCPLILLQEIIKRKVYLYNEIKNLLEIEMDRFQNTHFNINTCIGKLKNHYWDKYKLQVRYGQKRLLYKGLNLDLEYVGVVLLIVS